MTGASFDAEYFEVLRSGEGRAKRARAAFWSRFLARRTSEGARVLELGSGVGDMGAEMAKYRFTVPTDISGWAVRLLGRRGLHGLRLDARALPIARGRFDAVVAFDVLEHVTDPGEVVAEIHRVCKRRALVLVSVPNPDGLGARLKGDDWFGHRDPTHVSLWSEQRWTDLFESAGFTAERIGTDFLWDAPYPVKVPKKVQRVVAGGAQVAALRIFGALRWRQGENLLFVFRR